VMNNTLSGDAICERYFADSSRRLRLASSAMRRYLVSTHAGLAHEAPFVEDQ
jgi:hypothetical protein